jgi:peptide/nickel transport system permease protein
LIVAVVGAFWSPYGLAQMGTASRSGQASASVRRRPAGPRHLQPRHPRQPRRLLLSLLGTTLSLAIGSIAGLLSGYLRGWIDEVMQRLIETIVSDLPFLVLA